VKKLRITVNGVSYDVDVEVIEDDEDEGALLNPLPVSRPRQAPSAASAAPAPAPVQPSTPATRDDQGPAPAAGNGQRTLTSPIAGIVLDIKTSVGAAVKEREPVLVIEAMKMKTNISAPVTATVKSVEVREGDSVRQGQVLLTFE
jgi:biotin carboxyl carrier protein